MRKAREQRADIGAQVGGGGGGGGGGAKIGLCGTSSACAVLT
jgi:hypothetical protein